MADFCKQCSERLFGEDFKELANLMPDEFAEDGYAENVICEGCGPIQVNQKGECISPDCDHPGHHVLHTFPKERQQ